MTRLDRALPGSWQERTGVLGCHPAGNEVDGGGAVGNTGLRPWSSSQVNCARGDGPGRLTGVLAAG
jgi:hypothetical protein